MPNWKRFSQIHLSTAVVLILTTGALLGANLRKEKLIVSFGYSEMQQRIFFTWGWPYRFVSFNPDQNPAIDVRVPIGKKEAKIQSDALMLMMKLMEDRVDADKYRNFDIGICSAIAIAVFFISEWIARRRDSAK